MPIYRFAEPIPEYWAKVAQTAHTLLIGSAQLNDGVVTARDKLLRWRTRADELKKFYGSLDHEEDRRAVDYQARMNECLSEFELLEQRLEGLPDGPIPTFAVEDFATRAVRASTALMQLDFDRYATMRECPEMVGGH